MTQRTLLNKTCLSLFGFTLRKNIGISLLSSAIVLIFSPFLLLQTVDNYLKYGFANDTYDFTTIFSGGAPVLAVAACGLFILFLLIDFSYLYNKSASDAFHSMPIKRVELLASKFFGAYVCSIIPLFVGYAGFAVILINSRVIGSFATLGIGFLYTALSMILCGLFTMIFIISAGSMFDAVVSFLTVNIGLPILMELVNNYCCRMLYGLSGVGNNELVEYCTPFARSLSAIINYSQFPEYVLFTVRSVITAVIAAAAFAFVCILLYNLRKSEKVTSAYAFPFMPVIVGIVISIMSYEILDLIFGGDNDFISIPGVVGAVIGAVIYNAVTNRGFKKIKFSFITAAASVAIVVITLLAVQLDVLGYETYVPKSSDILRADVNYVQGTMSIEDHELVRTLHNEIIEWHAEEEKEPGHYINMESVQISYVLKSGRTVVRSYSIPLKVATKERQEIINKYLPAQINYEFLKSKSKYLVINGTDGFTSEGVEKQFAVILTRDETQDFINAYCKDLSNTELNDKWFYTVMNKHYYVENYVLSPETYRTDNYYYQYFNVRTSFTNTKEFIDSLDIEGRNIIDE